jgi:hypothetical protein
MSFPYKNPISPSQLSGQQSLDRTKTFGTSYSTLSTGGYMEVYSLDQLYYTIPSSTYGPIEYSGNSIPITFSKGSGTTFSVDTLTLQPDNISSGRRKLGMLVYVYEQNQIYQFLIDNYNTLWNAATGSTGATIINDFGTTIKANSPQNISFINSWTANTIDGVSGQTYSTAVWKKYRPFTGNTSASCITDLYVTNVYGCSPINVKDLLIANSGITTTSITLSASTSTISLNSPSQQQITFFNAGEGAPTYNTYSPGTKIILQDNISSIGVGSSIGVDTGILWYATDLPGNSHEWYAGTRKVASMAGAAGFQIIGIGAVTNAAVTISGNTLGYAKGGNGYTDFLQVINNATGATNTSKWFRVNSTGGLEILNSTYTSAILSIADNGILGVAGNNTATTTSNDGTSNYLSFNNNNSQIYDDGNFHIHSRAVGGVLWINSNGGGINIGTQSPTSTGSIASSVSFATGTVNGYVTINTGRTVTTAAAYGYLTTGGAGTYPGGSQSVSISLYANNRIWGQEIDAFSDERMKDIQGEITIEEGLKLVTNLKPIKYTWKEGDDKGLKAGYSAQQVIKSGFNHLIGIIPKEGLEETTDEDGFTSPKDTQFSMNYDQVVPYHGIVIKHLLDEIKSLKEEIRLLKDKQ